MFGGGREAILSTVEAERWRWGDVYGGGREAERWMLGDMYGGGREAILSTVEARRVMTILLAVGRNL